MFGMDESELEELGYERPSYTLPNWLSVLCVTVAFVLVTVMVVTHGR